MNVADSASFEAAFDGIPEPDVVIANAGRWPYAELTSTTDDTWKRMIETNLTGAFYTLRAAAKRMKAEGVRSS